MNSYIYCIRDEDDNVAGVFTILEEAIRARNYLASKIDLVTADEDRRESLVIDRFVANKIRMDPGEYEPVDEIKPRCITLHCQEIALPDRDPELLGQPTFCCSCNERRSPLTLAVLG